MEGQLQNIHNELEYVLNISTSKVETIEKLRALLFPSSYRAHLPNDCPNASERNDIDCELEYIDNPIKTKSEHIPK